MKDCHVYLGVEIDNNLKWSSHIQTISNKSTKVLNFIKRNLYNFPADTKRTAYLTLVRPIMEYAAPVWDPYYNDDMYKYKEEQLNGYYLSILGLLALQHYYLPTLEQRRQSSRLTL